MRKSGATMVVVASLLALAVAGTVGSWAQDSSTKPPKNLKKVGDHWTPWDPPEPGPDAYIIQRGDTLWDLSQRWLADPFLWPQIWEQNRYILDSHWIYPGDPLVVPGKPTVVPEAGIPPSEETPEEAGAEGEQVVETPAPAVPPMLRLADAADVYCSGYIDPQHATSAVTVAGSEVVEKEHLGQGDVIYLGQGRNQGVQPGDEFTVVRRMRDVVHPTTEQVLGAYIRRLGKARVMLTQEDTSTAMIEFSCEDVQIGDELLPWHAIPLPQRASMPAFDRYDVTPSGGPTGEVVYLGHEWMQAGTGNVVHTDLGLASGLRPGDVLTVYRERSDLPRTMIGQAVVLTVEQTSSTVKVAYSVREMAVGDRVEIVR